jgi:ubiquinone/menaquinone biosynthesis C-methylase UbiE
MQTQDEIFATSESDRWYERNRATLTQFDPAADLPLRIIAQYGLNPRRVAEVGGSNGFRMAALARLSGAEATVIEPSKAAISDGQKLYPKVRFVNGTAGSIPLSETFDLVVVNFVFHWIDRSRLLASAAEVDKLVAQQGFLLIGDFFPSQRLRTDYHHLQGKVHTFKQDYSQIFLATGSYQSVCMLSGDHGSAAAPGMRFGIAVEQDRIGFWLLRKSTSDSYADAAAPSH